MGPSKSTPPKAGPAPLRFVVGTVEPHEVRVAYTRALRLFTVQLDGRTVYRDCHAIPWPARKAREIRTPGRELHTLIIEPPSAGAERHAYLVRLDGRPLVRVERRHRRVAGTDFKEVALTILAPPPDARVP